MGVTVSARVGKVGRAVGVSIWTAGVISVAVGGVAEGSGVDVSVTVPRATIGVSACRLCMEDAEWVDGLNTDLVSPGRSDIWADAESLV